MSSLTLIIISYLKILLLLTADCIMVIIFIKAKKKTTKLEWFGRDIVIILLLLVAVIDMFLTFTSGITAVFDNSLVIVLSNFVSTLASISFLAIILAKRRILKFI